MAAASTTPVDVCNLALLYIANGQTITALDDRTSAARACKVFYAKARDALLESFPWKFATKRSVLALSTEERTGWAYVYDLPADCLAPRSIYPGKRMPSALEKIPFDVEGTLLLTDWAEAELIYTFQETVVAHWPALFVEALAWALAMKLCLTLPVKPEWSKGAKVEAELAFRKAGAAQFRATQEDPTPPSEYTSAR